jgi:hypothetical protein
MFLLQGRRLALAVRRRRRRMGSSQTTRALRRTTTTLQVPLKGKCQKTFASVFFPA